jgi:hypothetical protein
VDINPLYGTRHRYKFLGYFKLFIELIFGRSPDSVVGIATSYGLDDRGVGVRLPVGSRIFTSPNRPEVHPTSFPMGTGASFPGGQAAGA